MKKLLLKIEANFVVHEDFGRFSGVVMSLYETMYRNHGLEYTCTWMKNSRLAITQYVTGYPLSRVDYVELREGIPRWILSIDPALPSKRLTDAEFRMWHTLLSVSRAFTTKPVLDISSIVEPSKHQSHLITDFEVSQAAKELRVSRFWWVWRKFHLSTKSGPNGQALATCLDDLNRLPKRLYDGLKFLGGKGFRVKVSWLRHPMFKEFYQNSFPTKTKGLYRKLSYFSDKEAKTRTIAIVDYWTQTILRPLHNKLNDLLRRIKCDCTFNQDAFSEILGTDGPFYSLDLKSATDRMPVDFQERVLSLIVGPTCARYWKEVLSDFPFVSDAGKIKYLAGQPMGAYSSWPAMALTHHIIVRIAARREGILHFADYCILGDDIVIRNKTVAESYQRLLKILDMPISVAKTHVSDDTYEFAKRWVRRGSEVTGFSVSGLFETWKSYPLFQNFVETQTRKGWSFRDGRGPDLFLGDVMSALGKRQQSHRTKKLINIYMLLKSFLLKEESSTALQLCSLVAPSGVTFSGDLHKFVKKILCQVFILQSREDLASLQADFFTYLLKTVDSMLKWHEAKKLKAEEINLLRTSLLKRHPIPQVFDYRMEEIIKQLEDVKAGRVSLFEVFESKEIKSKAWTSEIFSIRASNSRILAQSKLVKDFMRAYESIIPRTCSKEINVDELRVRVDPSLFYQSRKVDKSIGKPTTISSDDIFLQDELKVRSFKELFRQKRMLLDTYCQVVKPNG